jgi:putative transposase
MCKVLKVSVSGYCYWLKHPVGLRQSKETELLSQIRQIHTSSKGRYGSPRIAHELKDRGIKASRNRVARLMNKGNIKSILHGVPRTKNTAYKPRIPNMTVR